MKTVTVDAAALAKVLKALVGPSHLIRELLVIAELEAKLPGTTGGSPITTLIDDYNKAAEAYNLEAGDETN